MSVVSSAAQSNAITRTIAVPCAHGIHLRVAAEIVMLAKGYDCTMWLTCNNRSAKACSILGLLELGARRGDVVLIGAHGPDAEQAVAAMLQLFASHACKPA